MTSGFCVGPVRQHDHVLAIVFDRVAAARIDDQRTIKPGLFLKMAVAVVPVGAVLPDRNAVGESLARRDAGKAQTRHPVHVRRHPDAVPMDRGRLLQAIGYRDRHGITLAPAQQRSGHEPLTAVAIEGLPVIFIGTCSIVRSKWVPVRTGAPAAARASPTGQCKILRPAIALPARSPCTKRRRLMAPLRARTFRSSDNVLRFHRYFLARHPAKSSRPAYFNQAVVRPHALVPVDAG